MWAVYLLAVCVLFGAFYFVQKWYYRRLLQRQALNYAQTLSAVRLKNLLKEACFHFDEMSFMPLLDAFLLRRDWQYRGILSERVAPNVLDYTKEKWNVDGYSSRGRTFLMLVAAHRHQVTGIHALCKAGADVNLRGHSGMTALHWSARNGNLEGIHALLSYGADPSIADEAGFLALHWASLNGREKCIPILLAPKNYPSGVVPVDAKVRNGLTALMLASQNGHGPTCRLLIAAGADVNATDDRGFTALHKVASNGGANHLIRLLNARAVVKKNPNGLSPVHLAMLRGRKDIVLALLRHDKTLIHDIVEVMSLPLTVKADDAVRLVLRFIAQSAQIQFNEQLRQTLVSAALACGRSLLRNLALPGTCVPSSEHSSCDAAQSNVPRCAETGKPVLSDPFPRVGVRFDIVDDVQLIGRDLLLTGGSLEDTRIAPSQLVRLVEFLAILHYDVRFAPDDDSSRQTHWTELDSLWTSLEECFDVLKDVEGRIDDIVPLVCSFAISSGWKLPSESNAADRFEIEAESTSGTLNSRRARFVRFVERHEAIFKAVLRAQPMLLVGHLDFIISSPALAVRFKDLVPQLISFTDKMRWLREKILADKSLAAGRDRVAFTVTRSSLLESSCCGLDGVDSGALKGQVHVKFSDEEAEGPGVLREWIHLSSKEFRAAVAATAFTTAVTSAIIAIATIQFQLFNPDNGLFQCTTGHFLQPNPHSALHPDHLAHFEFAGRLVGLALFHGVLIDVSFTRAFLKHILGQPVVFEDLEQSDEAYYKGLKWMLHNSIDELMLDLTFSVNDTAFGATSTIDLKPNGSRIAVTDENKHEYVKLAAHSRMTLSIDTQIFAFVGGFREIIPRHFTAIFNFNELELLISGLPRIDLEDWETHTRYQGFSYDDDLVSWFWAILHDFSEEERAKLLQFCTGSSRVPVNGFASLLGMDGKVSRFTLAMVKGVDENQLPTASTCVNLLKLPRYKSLEQLRDRLRCVLEFGGQGFSFV